MILPLSKEEMDALDKLFLITYYCTPVRNARQAILLVDLIRSPSMQIHAAPKLPKGRQPYIKWIAPPNLVDSVKFQLDLFDRQVRV